MNRNEGKKRTKREVNLVGSKTSSSQDWKHLQNSMQGKKMMNGPVEAEVKHEK